MLLGSVESLNGCNELVNLIRISALNTAFCFHWGRVSVIKLLVSTCHHEGGYNLMVCPLKCLVIILGGGVRDVFISLLKLSITAKIYQYSHSSLN